MEEEHSGGHGETAGEYIQHHLTNLQVCRSDGEWVWNSCAGNFWTINVDSMAFSIILGLVFCLLFRKVAKNISTGRPGKLQAGDRKRRAARRRFRARRRSTTRTA